MTNVPFNAPDFASRFLSNYLNCLAKAGVPEKRRRWYVKHIEAFIKAQNGRKIKTLSVDDVNQYFDMPGCQSGLVVTESVASQERINRLQR